MNETVVYAPFPFYPAAYVPLTRRGLRLWTQDGPADPNAPDPPPPRGTVAVYRWHGPKLIMCA